MTPNADADARLAQRAQRLYWESDRSVNAIAEALDVSKGKLYELIHPLTVDLPCPDCGEAMAWPNRTGRDRGLLVCGGCGQEVEVDEGEAPPSPPRRPGRGSPFSRDGAADVEGILGLALGAAAVGIALYLLLRRR